MKESSHSIFANSPLTNDELAAYRGQGYELYTIEPRIYFIPGENMTSGSGLLYKFVKLS